jgi:hypothetical protein
VLEAPRVRLEEEKGCQARRAAGPVVPDPSGPGPGLGFRLVRGGLLGGAGSDLPASVPVAPGRDERGLSVGLPRMIDLGRLRDAVRRLLEPLLKEMMRSGRRPPIWEGWVSLCLGVSSRECRVLQGQFLFRFLVGYQAGRSSAPTSNQEVDRPGFHRHCLDQADERRGCSAGY